MTFHLLIPFQDVSYCAATFHDVCLHRWQINFREEAGPTEYIVWYCRMLTSGFLKLNADRYAK